MGQHLKPFEAIEVASACQAIARSIYKTLVGGPAFATRARSAFVDCTCHATPGLCSHLSKLFIYGLGPTLLGMCCLLGSSADAFAACAAWAMDGVIEISQSNNIDVTITVKTTQGGSIKGIATTGKDTGRVFGGIVDYPGLMMTIEWQNFPDAGKTRVRSRGVYTANITGDGRVINGETWDSSHPESRATFIIDEKLTCRLAASAPPAPPPPAPPPASAFCQHYATAAVAASQENMQLKCGNGGPRWSTVTASHLDWCMALNGNQGPPNTEAAARASALQTCRADVRAREEAVQKPGVPIGDIVKPVDPLDKLGVVKKPNEEVDQFLKKGP